MFREIELSAAAMAVLRRQSRRGKQPKSRPAARSIFAILIRGQFWSRRLRHHLPAPDRIDFRVPAANLETVHNLTRQHQEAEKEAA